MEKLMKKFLVVHIFGLDCLKTQEASGELIRNANTLLMKVWMSPQKWNEQEQSEKVTYTHWVPE